MIASGWVLVIFWLNYSVISIFLCVCDRYFLFIWLGCRGHWCSFGLGTDWWWFWTRLTHRQLYYAFWASIICISRSLRWFFSSFCYVSSVHLNGLNAFSVRYLIYYVWGSRNAELCSICFEWTFCLIDFRMFSCGVRPVIIGIYDTYLC